MLPTPEDSSRTPDMSPDAHRLFLFGLRLSRMPQPTAPTHAPAPAHELRCSDYIERIARDIAAHACLEVGLKAIVWGDLQAGERDRCRQLARRAVLLFDIQARIDAANEAARLTGEWMNEGYDGPGTEPSSEDIARYAIARYEAILSAASEGAKR